VLGSEVILDTNILLLLVVGSAKKRYVSAHKRLKAFTEADYDLLVSLLYHVQKIILTPNTLTETSNLAAQIDGPARAEIFAMFRKIIRAGEERYFPSAPATEQTEFARLRLTDAVLLNETLRSRTLLTADLNLFLAAQRRGHKAVNFSHYRDVYG